MVPTTKGVYDHRGVKVSVDGCRVVASGGRGRYEDDKQKKKERHWDTISC